MGLVARLSTMNTRVFLSSIVLMALSVLRGNLITANWSQVFCFLTEWVRALALRARVRVLGRLKVVLVQTLFFCAV